MTVTTIHNAPLDIHAPTHPPTYATTALTFAGRTLKQFVRTPQLIVVGALTSAMFLLIFRYVFGGAIQTGPIPYVDDLLPGVAAAGTLFAGTGAVVGVSEDIASGLFDRLRSLPVPRSAILLGRAVADVALVAWGTFITVALGFITGFRIHGTVGQALLAFGLCCVFGFAFTWPFIWLGLIAGNAQAAQGLSFLVFPFVFVSSAYVPVGTMPGWLQPFANNQPVTMMIGSVRSLTLGDGAEAMLGHPTSYFITRSLIWCVVIVAFFAPLATRKFTKR